MYRILYFLLLINLSCNSFNSQNDYWKQKYDYKTQENIKKLSSLDTNDFIKLRISRPYLEQGKFAKVEKITTDSVLLLKMITELRYDDNVSHLIKSYYYKNKEKLDSSWISFDELDKAICRSYDSTQLKLDFGVDLFKDGKKYLIDYIERIDDSPIIKTRNTGAYEHVSRTISIHLHNYGVPCNIVKIQNIVGNIEWTNTLPFYLKTNDPDRTFSLVGRNYEENSPYEIILHLETLDGKLVKYKVTGLNIGNTIKRVN